MDVGSTLTKGGGGPTETIPSILIRREIRVRKRKLSLSLSLGAFTAMARREQLRRRARRGGLNARRRRVHCPRKNRKLAGVADPKGGRVDRQFRKQSAGAARGGRTQRGRGGKCARGEDEGNVG